MRPSFLATVCLSLAGAIACTRPVERGEALYQGGRYVEAAENFELSESRLSSMSPESCASFGLYRGLTYLRLGDLENARKWLAYSYSIEQKSPGQLVSEQHRLLDRGWAELEHRTGPAGDTSREMPLASDAAGPAMASNALAAPAGSQPSAPKTLAGAAPQSASQ